MYIRYLAFRNGNRFNVRRRELGKEGIANGLEAGEWAGERGGKGENKFSLENEKCTGHGANELNFTSFAKFTARKSRRD